MNPSADSDTDSSDADSNELFEGLGSDSDDAMSSNIKATLYMLWKRKRAMDRRIKRNERLKVPIFILQLSRGEEKTSYS